MCATLCFRHLLSEMKKRKHCETNVLFRNDADIEAVLMTCGGPGRSFLGPSKVENLSFSEKSENEKKHVFSSLPCLLAHFGVPWIFGVLEIAWQKNPKRLFFSTRFFLSNSFSAFWKTLFFEINFVVFAENTRIGGRQEDPFFDVFVPAPTVLTTFGRQKTRKTQKCETEGEGRQPVRFHAWYDNGNLGHPKTLIFTIFSTYL